MKYTYFPTSPPPFQKSLMPPWNKDILSCTDWTWILKLLYCFNKLAKLARFKRFFPREHLIFSGHKSVSFCHCTLERNVLTPASFAAYTSCTSDSPLINEWFHVGVRTMTSREGALHKYKLLKCISGFPMITSLQKKRHSLTYPRTD